MSSYARSPTLVPLLALAAASGMALTLVAATEACVPSASAGMPADEHLRAQYAAHAGDFEALRDMIRAEATVQTVGDDNVGECWGGAGGWSCAGAAQVDEAGMLVVSRLEKARYDRYMGLLHAVGGSKVTRRTGGGVAVGLFHAQGGSSGAEKELVWLPNAPYPIVADTDVKHSVQYYVSYATVADGWYIARSRD